MSHCSSYFQYHAGRIICSNDERKKGKGIQIGKDEFTLSLYEEGIIWYMRPSNLHYTNARSNQQFKQMSVYKIDKK